MSSALSTTGEGFGVDIGALRQAATRAGSLGVQLDALRAEFDATLRTAQSVGLGVGAALTEMASSWDALLSCLADRVAAAGSTLSATAGSYADTEARVSSLLSRVGS